MTDHAIAERAWTAFDRLGIEAQRALRELGAMRTFERDGVILAEAGETPFLGAVEQGRVALRLRTPELGVRVTIATVEPGDLIGWSALVPPFRATCDAVATEPVVILAFAAEAVRARLATDRNLAAELLPLVLETVARRLTTSWHQLLDMFEPRGRGPW